jgi:hypothetical protein
LLFGHDDYAHCALVQIARTEVIFAFSRVFRGFYAVSRNSSGVWIFLRAASGAADRVSEFRSAVLIQQ